MVPPEDFVGARQVHGPSMDADDLQASLQLETVCLMAGLEPRPFQSPGGKVGYRANLSGA